ncbi:UNVERIFIED_CONTAM: hypothetical protein FKN15_066018 [Acipenser sinensis]
MAPELSDPDGKRRGIRGLEERMRSLTSGSWARPLKDTEHEPELQPQASVKTRLHLSLSARSELSLFSPPAL